MKDLYLGVDTSNYTTSLAIVDSNNNIIFDKRIVLDVEKGKKGLRQQEALFQHIKNLPIIFEEMNFDKSKIKAIGVSTRPRNEENSYMPCFLAGLSFAKTVSHSLNVPFKSFSHQEGHIACILLDEGMPEGFLGLHLSGGTTEIIKCFNGVDNLYTEIIGGSLDISFGQLIDRLGVKIGLEFPAGPELESLARNGVNIDLKIPYRVKDRYFNLSGLENYFNNLINQKKYKIEDICCTLFTLFANILVDLILDTVSKTDIKTIFVVGGVASNTIIRNSILKKFSDLDVIFTNKDLSSDNAVGIAYLARINKGWEV